MMVLKKIVMIFCIFILIAGYVSASIIGYSNYRQKAESMKNELMLLNTKLKELELESERLDRLRRAMMPYLVAEAEKKSEASLQPNKVSAFNTASTTAFSPLAQPSQTFSSKPAKKTVKVIKRIVPKPTQNQAAATQLSQAPPQQDLTAIQPEPIPPPLPPPPPPVDPDPVVGGAS